MPKPFNTLTAIAAPIMRANIDTDVIIRIERLVGNAIRGTLGKWAFGALRYLRTLNSSSIASLIEVRKFSLPVRISVAAPRVKARCGRCRKWASAP